MDWWLPVPGVSPHQGPTTPARSRKLWAPGQPQPQALGTSLQAGKACHIYRLPLGNLWLPQGLLLAATWTALPKRPLLLKTGAFTQLCGRQEWMWSFLSAGTSVLRTWPLTGHTEKHTSCVLNCGPDKFSAGCLPRYLSALTESPAFEGIGREVQAATFPLPSVAQVGCWPQGAPLHLQYHRCQEAKPHCTECTRWAAGNFYGSFFSSLILRDFLSRFMVKL